MTENEVGFIKVLVSVIVVFVPLFIAFLWGIGAIGGGKHHKDGCVQSMPNPKDADTSSSGLSTFEALVVASVVADSFDGGSNGE